jgi:hypothetical protein
MCICIFKCFFFSHVCAELFSERIVSLFEPCLSSVEAFVWPVFLVCSHDLKIYSLLQFRQYTSSLNTFQSVVMMHLKFYVKFSIIFFFCSFSWITSWNSSCSNSLWNEIWLKFFQIVQGWKVFGPNFSGFGLQQLIQYGTNLNERWNNVFIIRNQAIIAMLYMCSNL